jgi:hypothetical protein
MGKQNSSFGVLAHAKFLSRHVSIPDSTLQWIAKPL